MSNLPQQTIPQISSGNFRAPRITNYLSPRKGWGKELMMIGTTIKDMVATMPYRVWFTLAEAVELKGGAALKTYQNRRWLQPNGGDYDAVVGGKKVFSRQAVLEWLNKSDSDLKIPEDSGDENEMDVRRDENGIPL